MTNEPIDNQEIERLELEIRQSPAERSEQAVNALIAFTCTCRRRNSPEWMAHLADRLNAAIAALGSDDRVKWPGSWANEFQLEIGGENLKEVT